MNRKEVCRRVSESGIVAVIRASSVSKALEAAEAISAGGISIIEVTMTVPKALDAIAELTQAARRKTAGTNLLVGAGTVLDREAAARCIEAGAEFLVSPGFDRETVEFVRGQDKVMMAGALTPTEVIAAWKAGADFVKVFPCSAVGGASYIKALKGPLPQIPLVPTGGVNLSNAADFIRAGSAAIGVGGELVSEKLLSAGNTAAITELAAKFVAAVQQARQGEAVSMAGD